MTMQRTSKALTADLARARAWCAARLERGDRVWCVRRRDGGLVVTFITGSAEDVGTWLSFDGEPLDNFTLTPMLADPEMGARFGVECDWRGGMQC